MFARPCCYPDGRWFKPGGSSTGSDQAEDNATVAGNRPDGAIRKHTRLREAPPVGYLAVVLNRQAWSLQQTGTSASGLCVRRIARGLDSG